MHIHRVPATSLGRRSTLTRMADYLSFYARAVVKAMRLPRFDTVVTLTTPPIIGLVGTLLRRLKGTPHVYWSMDLHPDASLALRRMSPRNPVGARPGLAEQPRFIARPTAWSCLARTWPIGSLVKGVRTGPGGDDPGLEPPRRGLSRRPREPTRCASRSGLPTSSWPCTRETWGWPIRSRVPRGGPAASRPPGHRLPVRGRRAPNCGGPRSPGA